MTNFDAIFQVSSVTFPVKSRKGEKKLEEPRLAPSPFEIKKK